MAKSKQRERFEALVRGHARVMSAAIRRVCGRRHRSLVPDVQQEVYLALWKRLESGKEIAYPTSYLYRVALTTALAVVRRLETEVPMLAEDDDPALGQEPPAGAGELPRAERRAVLRQVLERLEPAEARALRAYLAGFSHTEVARLYGWSESVARHRIYRTLERLRTEARGTRGDEDEKRTASRG